MLSIIDFNDCCYSNITDEHKHNIFTYLAHHMPKRCVQFNVCGKVYKWWFTYCDMDDCWYTTNNLIENSSGIKIGRTFVSKVMPEFFDGYLILYNYERNMTFMININIPEHFNESSFYINGLVYYTKHFAYYQSNYSKHFYVLTKHTNNMFRSVIDANTYEYLHVNRICSEFAKSERYFIIQSWNQKYISHIEKPDRFYKIDSIPDDDKEADKIYKQLDDGY